MTAIRITVARTAGSAPRDAGTRMLVRADGTIGTIGGGALEWQAMRDARAMLADGRTHLTRTIPLGPGLGQCCGGSVTLTWERADTLDEPAGAPLWIWGAGHVGAALARVVAPHPAYDVTLIDARADILPDIVGVTPVHAARPDTLARHAPTDADHIVATHDHATDLALCHALLSHDFASLGLIGSATKRARFRQRLSALGHAPEQIARIACPIGDPSLGKHPQALAVGVAAVLMGPRDRMDRARHREDTG